MARIERSSFQKILQKLHPIGLNPTDLDDRVACALTKKLDGAEKKLKQVGITSYDEKDDDRIETNSEGLLQSCRDLAAMGPRIGRRKFHRPYSSTIT